MYNTPDKHRKSTDGRSKFDFSDIDHLDRATEAFMKEQRKALGHRSVNLDAVADQGKRILVFVVLGAVFVTALVAGIRFGISDDELRDPNSSVSDSLAESGTNQTTDGSSSDQSKNDANGAATTSTTTAEPTTSVTTEPTTYQEDPTLSTTLPQLTDSNIVIQTTTTTAATGGNQTTIAGTTTQKTTATSRTTPPKNTTRTTSTMTSTTTRRSTTSTTSTTRKTTTTTSKTTVTTRKTSTSTTTTTTTTAAKKANLTVQRTRVVSCEEQDAGGFVVKVQVFLQNKGDAAASNVEVTVGANNCSYVSTDSGNWSAHLSGGRPVAEYYGTVAPNGEVSVTLFFITNRYLSSCSASCSFH